MPNDPTPDAVERPVELVLWHLTRWADVDITVAPQSRQEIFAKQLLMLLRPKEQA